MTCNEGPAAWSPTMDIAGAFTISPLGAALDTSVFTEIYGVHTPLHLSTMCARLKAVEMESTVTAVDPI